MIRLVVILAGFAELVLVAGQKSEKFGENGMDYPFCCPPGYEKGKHFKRLWTGAQSLKWYCDHPFRKVYKNHSQVSNAILLQQKDPKCSGLGTETKMLEPYHKNENLDIIATLKTYSAVVSTLKIEKKTDWNQNYDEPAIGLACNGPDGKKIQVLNCDYSELQEGESVSHPDSKDYPYCGLERIEGCDIESNLTIYLSETDSEKTHDLGKYDIPASVLKVLAVGGTMDVRISPGTYSEWDTFWQAFWTFKGEVCVTDFIPVAGKMAQAAKLSARTIMAIKKMEKIVDRADKFKTFVLPLVDVAQCRKSASGDCKDYLPDYAPKPVVPGLVQKADGSWGKGDKDLSQKCEPVFDECVSDQYAKNLSKALGIEEKSGVSKFADEVWKKQCWGPPDEGGTFMLTIRFLPPSDYSKTSDAPAYTDPYDTQEDWINCKECNLDPMCKDAPEKFLGWRQRTEKDQVTPWDKEFYSWGMKKKNPWDNYWGTGSGPEAGTDLSGNAVRRFEVLKQHVGNCWSHIGLLDETVDGSKTGGSKDEKINGSPQVAGALSILNVAVMLTMVF